MATVSGPLMAVTENPAQVVEVWVRAPQPRPHNGGIITDLVDRVPVEGGQVTFTCAPGPAVLTVVSLVSTGRVSPGQVPDMRAVPIMVPDAAAATLADVVTAAQVATLGRSVVEELAARVATDVAAAQEAARAAASDAQLVQDAATSAVWTGDVLTVLGASSPPLTGPRGKKGDKGDTGDQGPPGDVSTAQLDAALASKADLIGGVVPTSQIPAVALTKPHQVYDRAGMLALPDVQEGDVAVISTGVDKGTYMLSSGPAAQFSSWAKLTTPDAPVQSVNAQTGTVVLSAADVGARPSTWKPGVEDVMGLPMITTAATAAAIVQRASGGHVELPSSVPTTTQAVRRAWVEELIDQVVGQVRQIHWGMGPPPSPLPATMRAGDAYIDETPGAPMLYKIDP